MSKKHFIAIAAKFNESLLRIDNELPAEVRATARSTARDLANSIADVCCDENPQFDRARFLTACGINS